MAKKTKASGSTFNMAGTEEVSTFTADDTALLASLLDELEEPTAEVDALSDAEDDTVVAAESVSEAALPLETDLGEPEIETEKPAVKAEKAKKEKKVKEPKEPKAPRVTAITHKPGDRLLALIGGDKSFLTFSISEDLTTQANKADEFIANMNSDEVIADKVREKAVMLLTWLKAERPVSDLNAVLARSFSVLFRDGELVSGKDGNSQKDLLAKPFSPGTAASQSNQIFMLFPLLGITVREKGRMVLNEDSVIAALVKDKFQPAVTA